ncbi:hypothetical protein H6P81_019224 [Aristolochia fimbriata]|uniref:U6 snRNA phosphodiesterase n=1 Tax=Aristolochia fimbriata TaxID=158543 RepID=A0AAV7DST3_ARIFI|nr:hypothetical protein H6P81_019224 [Aristolochia fimbriata]
MDALMASYACSSSDSEESSEDARRQRSRHFSGKRLPASLPPPPLAPLHPPNSLVHSQTDHGGRFRSFPHVEGNYALHVFIPVLMPPSIRKELIPAMRKVTSLVPGLHVVDDVPLSDLCKDVERLEQVALGREFHISLGRTVPIRVHQIDSIVSMLRQKLQSQKRYLIDFSKWEVFVNDDQTRTFLSMEVIAGGLAEIRRQIHVVDDIYRLHNLPEFYKNPRPHISLAWALGDISHSLKQAIEELNRCCITSGFRKKHIFGCTFNGIQCKIGKKFYKIF